MKTMTGPVLLSACFFLTITSAAVAQQTAVTANPPIPPVAVTVSDQVWVEGRQMGKNSFKEEDLKSKEISKEVALPKDGEIYIENASRSIVVKTWDQPKVKVSTTIYYDGESKLSDDEWLEKANLSLRTLGNSVKIKSGTISGAAYRVYSSGAMTFYSSGPGNGVTVFNGSGQNIGTKSGAKTVVTVTIPAGSKIELESKYADVTLPANIGEANIELANGNLEAENLNKLILRSKYSNVTVGDVKNAEIEFTNGRFSARNITDLDIDSKYSTIEMASVNKLAIRSTNDEYELEEADEVRGRKSYGNLRITKLNRSIDVEGSNADIKIRKTAPTLSLIKIDDKYADIRIPLKDTKNYSVDFTGSFSSVYGNFEKKAVAVAPDKEEPKATTEKNAELKAITVIGRATAPRLSGGWNDENNPSKFTASVGDGKGLKVEVKCQNCTVDLK
ncbi:MAG: hypothetical protein IM584_03165 [Chitinophagaceae bacterium]|nr:hypothetical protein [Chitinophagaceae bacterium]MCA6454427.1 hypothetical protein [Chitinophagaceae bacterium]MCA6455115.1 hypothetical protein [Chitinophagaceae bacterium]MCA6458805.1 hypothetical protein [Chitinophagaceae bacterium]MCA6464313.1 hypothetical protein [Chitinophagaceae bacterium]